MNILFLYTILVTNSNLDFKVKDNIEILYHTFIYRLKITCRSVLKKENDVLYNKLTNIHAYDHKKYFPTLYTDFKNILNRHSFIFNKVFEKYLRDLIDAEDLRLDESNKKILNFASNSLKSSVNLVVAKNNLNELLFKTQKNLNLHFLLFLRKKFKKLSKFKISFPELFNILFYIFSLLDFVDEKRISTVLSEFSVIYAVIIKNEENEIFDLAYIYNILGEIMFKLVSYPHFTTEFTILKEQLLSHDGDKIILRKFGIFFILEKHLKSKMESLKFEIKNLENEPVFGNLENEPVFGNLENEPVFGNLENEQIFGNLENEQIFGNLENEQIFGNLEKLIALFYSLN